MAVFRLDTDRVWFPMPQFAEENGLLAVGGDLSVKRLLLAYQHGIFPWYNPGEEILWWCPRERFVIIPREIHISHSLKKYIRRCQQEKRLEVRYNQNFPEVMHQCRLMRESKEGTWISDEMEAAYGRLFQAGYVLSVEVYESGQLTGGLYGVFIGKCFFGESMFSKTKNASKIALVVLAAELRKREFEFIDCQFHTEHLERMGGRYICYEEYQRMLYNGVHK